MRGNVRRSLGLLVVALACPAVAVAARPAQPEELAAMAAAEGLDPACMTASVSSVDPRWARMQSASSPPVSCAGGDGFFVMSAVSGAWREVTQAPEPFACEAAAIPIPVGRDLGVCRPREAYVSCLSSRSTERSLRIEPGTCQFVPENGPFANAANLVALRWRGWGHAVATAVGREKGFMGSGRGVRARVTLSGRRVDCEGDHIYTRVKVRTRYGTGRLSLPGVC